MDLPQPPQVRYRRRAWYKRRRLWIVLLAVLGAIALTLYLIRSMDSKGPMD